MAAAEQNAVQDTEQFLSVLGECSVGCLIHLASSSQFRLLHGGEEVVGKF